MEAWELGALGVLLFILWFSLGLGIATVEEKVDKVLKELEELRKRLED
jgi:hypothetical protein